MTVDPVRRNYVTVKLWGEDDGDLRTGRLYLYVPVNGTDYQVGFRHEGDYMPLSVASTKPPLPGRFFLFDHAAPARDDAGENLAHA